MHQQLLHSIKSASAIKIKDQSNLNFHTIKMCYLPFYDYIFFSVSYYRQKEATKGKMLCQLKVSLGDHHHLHWERRKSKPQLEEFAGSKILLPVFSKNNHRHSWVFCRIRNLAAAEKSTDTCPCPRQSWPVGFMYTGKICSDGQMDTSQHLLRWLDCPSSSPAQAGFRSFFDAL